VYVCSESKVRFVLVDSFCHSWARQPGFLNPKHALSGGYKNAVYIISVNQPTRSKYLLVFLIVLLDYVVPNNRTRTKTMNTVIRD
jgi:hypothetical protein